MCVWWGGACTGLEQVEVAVSQLSGFLCAEEEVRFSYKHKNLKTAFCNLPNPRDYSDIKTKVSSRLALLMPGWWRCCSCCGFPCHSSFRCMCVCRSASTRMGC